MKSKAFLMGFTERYIVLNSIKSTCDYRGWILYAVHIRTNHVHLLVKSDASAEKTLSIIKAYASRDLNKHFLCVNKGKYWSRHGSTRYVWSSMFLYPAMEYVIDRQGERMACYYQDWYDDYKSIGDFD